MSKKKLIPLIGPDPLTDEWFQKRSEIIGSSEAAKACGMSEYGTPLQLYLEKTGQIAPFAGNEHTRRGRRYEPLIAEDWQDLTGRKLRRYPCPMFLHPEHKGIAATPDGEIDDDEGLEIKSTTFRMRKKLGAEDTDDIPNDWLFQAQQQMAVMGWRVVHFCILVDLEPCVYKVERNDDLINMMISAELELLERIKNGDPPEPNWEHESTPDLIRAMHRTDTGNRIMLSAEAVAARMEYERLGKIARDAEEGQKKVRAIYEAEIGDNFAGVLPDGRMIRRKWIEPGHRSFDVEGRWDYKAVKFDNGPIQGIEPDDTVPDSWALIVQAEVELNRHGYRLKEESESGSRYYASLGRPDARVSDHDPNEATANWINRNGVIDIRLDPATLAEQLAAVASRLGIGATA